MCRDLKEQWIRAKYERKEFIEEPREKALPYTTGIVIFIFIGNPSYVTRLILYSLKTSGNQRFVIILGGIERDQWHGIGY